MNRNNQKSRTQKKFSRQPNDRKRDKNPGTSTSGKYVELPVEFIPNPKMVYMRRYSATSAGNVDLTIADLFNTKILAATTVLGYSPHYAVRLKRLRLWGPVTTIGTPVTISIFPKLVETDINSYGDMPELLSDTSTSITKPAFIEWFPKKTQPAGSWHYTTSATTGLFKVFYPIGSVLELLIEGVENLQTGTLGFTSVLSAASPGGVYARNVATNFQPISINSI